MKKKYSDVIVYNPSISGNTSKDLLQRFDVELKARMEEDWSKNHIIIAIGGNDAAFMHERNDNWVNVEKFKENMKTVIGKVRDAKGNPMCIGITPIDQEKVDPCPWDTKISYRNEESKKFEDAIKDVCAAESVPFLPMIDYLKGEGYDKMLFDGVHPNAEGHQKIYERVKKFLEEQGVIE